MIESGQEPAGAARCAGYVALVVRSWPSLWGAAVPPWFLPAVGAAYLLLALAAVYLTQTELRMPLVHYRMRAQVGLAPPLSFPPRTLTKDPIAYRDSGVLLVCTRVVVLNVMPA